MQITRQQNGTLLVMKIKGRLDSFWADHLSRTLDEAIREGSHQIRLDLAEVDYLSSAGIRVLVQSYKQLGSLKGSFAINSPSSVVRKLLEMVKLDKILIADANEQAQSIPAQQSTQLLEKGNGSFEVYALNPSAFLECRPIGDPNLLSGCRFSEQDCRNQVFREPSFGLGLGALGSNFQECRGNFGEFLAVAGAAAYLPTGGANIPDYMLAAGTLVPEVKILYGLTCDGQFARLVRFEAKKERGWLSLGELASTCLDISGGDAAGMVMVAETAGLVGAALKRSPILAAADAPFGRQHVREWISYTAERAHARALTLVVGIAAKSSKDYLGAWLRPLGRDCGLLAHFHAAVFSYHPLKKGRLDLKSTVSDLFETESLRDLLHLLSDDREITGAGQSEFIRGACWLGPIPDSALKELE